MGSRESGKQKLIVVLGAIGVLLVSVVMTAMLIDGGLLWQKEESGGYKNVTFTDAVLTCQDTTNSKFSDKIRSLVVDNHSSRYESKLFIYKIFLKVYMESDDSGEVNLHYINCFVKSSSGRVKKYEVFEDKEEETTPVTEKETNAFGWPK